MQMYTIKQLTRITYLHEDQVEEQLAFIARILPQGISQDPKGRILISDNALTILKHLAEKELVQPGF